MKDRRIVFGSSKKTTAWLLTAAVLLLSLQLFLWHKRSSAPTEAAGWQIPAHDLPVPSAASLQLRNSIALSHGGPWSYEPQAVTTPSALSQLIDSGNRTGQEFTAGIRGAFPDIVVTSSSIDGVAVYTATPKTVAPENTGRLLIHLHGGAYVMLGGEAAVAEAIVLAHYTGMRVLSVDYRMPPDNPFPAALGDVVTVWSEVIKTYAPARVGIGGTSAGGGLTLAAVLRLKQLGLPLPGALFCGTPWADLTFKSDSLNTNKFVDDVIPTAEGFLSVAAKLYAGSHDRRDPLISPVYGDFRGFPPAILLTGTRDLMLSDTVRVHRKLRQAGIDAELEVFEGLSHAEYLGLIGSPESVDAWTEVAAFFSRHLAE